MQIGVDARMIDRKKHTGIARHVRNLLIGLTSLRDDNHYTLFLKPQDADTIDLQLVEKRTTTAPIYSLGEQLTFARSIAKENLDLFHSPHYILPLAYRGRSIITVHDLIHFHFPASRAANIYARLMLPLTVKKAAKVIAVSNATKQDLIRRLGVEDAKVVVIPNGVERSFHPITDTKSLETFRARHGLPGRFILYTGATKPHKNLPVLLEALARNGSQIPLVLTANADNLEDPRINEYLERYSLKQRVLFVGFLPEEEMPLLYNSATFLVLPSLYEGFGFPALEAMACGLPVICSNTTSLPEVVGDAALTFNPKNSSELTEHMSNLISNASLAQELANKGISRAATFSWEKVARETAKLYSETKA